MILVHIKKLKWLYSGFFYLRCGIEFEKKTDSGIERRYVKLRKDSHIFWDKKIRKEIKKKRKRQKENRDTWHCFSFILTIFTFIIFQFAVSGRNSGCPHGVKVKAMDCGILVSEFVFQSRYYVHFRTNTLGKGMNPLILFMEVPVVFMEVPVV